MTLLDISYTTIAYKSDRNRPDASITGSSSRNAKVV